MSNAMMLPTGTRRITCNVTTFRNPKPAANADAMPNGKGAKDKPAKPPSLEEANFAVDEATKQQEAAQQDVDRKQANEDTKGKSDAAMKASDRAHGMKGDTETTRRAHQEAAIAHRDASSGYKAQAGEKSGNDPTARAKALRLSAAHDEHAERHDTLSTKPPKLPSSTLNAGNPRITVNVWSDEARAASAATRAAGAKGKPTTTGRNAPQSPLDQLHDAVVAREHSQAIQQKTGSHKVTASAVKHRELAGKHEAAADAIEERKGKATKKSKEHRLSAKAHRIAAKSIAEGKEGKKESLLHRFPREAKGAVIGSAALAGAAKAGQLADKVFGSEEEKHGGGIAGSESASR